MRKLLLSCWLLVIIGAAPTWATIPLVLNKTIQLPVPYGSWDVQHVLDDSLLAWSCLISDTLTYQLSENDSIHVVIVPDTVFRVGAISPPQLRGARLLRLAITDSHPSALIWASVRVEEDGSGSWSEKNVLGFFDLTLQTFVDTVSMYGSFSDIMPDGADQQQTSSLTQFFPWPPLPDAATTLYYVESDDQSGYWPGGNTWGQHSGCIRVMRFGSTPRSVHYDNMDNLQWFNGATQPLFAVSGQVVYHYRHGYDGDVIWEYRCWLTTFGSSGLAQWDSSDGCSKVVAQSDGNGTHRIILEHSAIDADDYATLWENPSLTGTVYSARLAGSRDERLLQASNLGYFSVYDASDGSFIDWTSAYHGDLTAILKTANRPAELVTYDLSTRLIRVYGTTVPPTRSLTIRYIPESNLLRLRWRESPGAMRYSIYAADEFDGEYSEIAQVGADTTTYDLTPTNSAKSFRVTAVCDTP